VATRLSGPTRTAGCCAIAEVASAKERIMKTEAFTWVALGVGLALALIALPASVPDREGNLALPLLTLLLLNEFGFILTALGAALGIRRLRAAGLRFPLLAAVAGCAVLAFVFAGLGLSLWPGGG
jgi:cytochrome bd-type quinol oxidase subunit 2